MEFDLFHSLSRADAIAPKLNCREVFTNFLDQVVLAEELGFSMVWVAESHFSSEVQKGNANPVIPNYQGEVGMNCDSFQLAQLLFSRTRRIGFGTAIHNIVGGSGGPVASADRVVSLAFLNQLLETPRKLAIGFASGRFPYINEPFGIVPRSAQERANWSEIKRFIFLEALEIFLRLVSGEALSSSSLKLHRLANGVDYPRRWAFERLQLIPELREAARSELEFVLGSHDPEARRLALELADCSLFNLSYTPVNTLNKLHEEMFTSYRERHDRKWHRRRLPRTVMIFIDESQAKAEEHASKCFDAYIEAMRGTVECPAKEDLLKRALVGTPTAVREQLAPDHPLGFHQDDRLMLWFEFNQNEPDKISQQMRLFAEKVRPYVA